MVAVPETESLRVEKLTTEMEMFLFVEEIYTQKCPLVLKFCFFIRHERMKRNRRDSSFEIIIINVKTGKWNKQ